MHLSSNMYKYLCVHNLTMPLWRCPPWCYLISKIRMLDHCSSARSDSTLHSPSASLTHILHAGISWGPMQGRKIPVWITYIYIYIYIYIFVNTYTFVHVHIYTYVLSAKKTLWTFFPRFLLEGFNYVFWPVLFTFFPEGFYHVFCEFSSRFFTFSWPIRSGDVKAPKLLRICWFCIVFRRKPGASRFKVFGNLGRIRSVYVFFTFCVDFWATFCLSFLEPPQKRQNPEKNLTGFLLALNICIYTRM